jgi:hypothetical protein
MIDLLTQYNIKWDAVIAGIVLVVCLSVSIFNLWHNNRKP